MLRDNVMFDVKISCSTYWLVPDLLAGERSLTYGSPLSSLQVQRFSRKAKHGSNIHCFWLFCEHFMSDQRPLLRMLCMLTTFNKTLTFPLGIRVFVLFVLLMYCFYFLIIIKMSNVTASHYIYIYLYIDI